MIQQTSMVKNPVLKPQAKKLRGRSNTQSNTISKESEKIKNLYDSFESYIDKSDKDLIEKYNL